MVNSSLLKKKNTYFFFFILALTSVINALFSQEIKENTDSNASKTKERNYSELPLGFDKIILYKKKDEIINIINNNKYFRNVKEPEISFLPSTREQLLTVKGKGFIKEGLFQFTLQNTLKVIILYLNKKDNDYYSMYTLFSNKYGRPYFISPTQVSWKNEQVRIIIEKSLTIKYIAIKGDTDEEKKKKDNIKTRKELREEFLSYF